MSRFGSGKTFASEGSGNTETKHMKVTNIKGSSEKGRKKLVGREKGGMRKAMGVEILIKEAKKVKRKDEITIQVTEKRDDSTGRQGRASTTGFKTYYCDEAPEKYGGGGKCQFKSFSGSSRINGGRTKFN